MAGRKHGVYGQIMADLDGTSPATYAELADLNGWTLSMTRDRQPAVAFGDTNIIRVAGLPDYSGTISGLWNSASSPTLFAAILAGDPVYLKLVPNRTESTYFFSGLANLDGTVTVGSGGVVGITGTWDAADNWEMAP
jgi:hypothetical protein